MSAINQHEVPSYKSIGPNYVHPQERIARDCNVKLIDAIEDMRDAIIDKLSEIQECVAKINKVFNHTLLQSDSKLPGELKQVDSIPSGMFNSYLASRIPSPIDIHFQNNNIGKRVITEQEAKDHVGTNPHLLHAIQSANFSVRTHRILTENNIKFIFELVYKTEEELMAYKGFGKTCLEEVKNFFDDHGLRLNSDKSL